MSTDHRFNHYSSQPRGFLTPPPAWKAPRRGSPLMPASEKKPRRLNQWKDDPFHVIHKVPSGDSPYVRAKHVQLIDKDPGRAVSLFWSAINAGDRVDSALKDMAVVMKQLDRSDEAVEAIKSFRHLCPPESQESIDNILIELYKQSGRIEEEIELLKLKLKLVEEEMSFGGKRTKMVRSQGKKIHITVEKEYSRLLGNLAWAYMQQKDFEAAEEHYRKALSFESDKNKQCNLAVCLMHRNKLTEAKFLLQAVGIVSGKCDMDETFAKSHERASLMLDELESQHVNQKTNGALIGFSYEEKGSLEWRSNSYSHNIGGYGHTRPYNHGFPQAPHTQPQRYNKRYGGIPDKACVTSCQKVLFDSSSTEGATVQTSLVNRTVDSCCSTDSIPEIPHKSERDLPSDDTVFYPDLCCKLTTEMTLEPSDEKATGHCKSWADMVEQEDECDENVDSNIIISETPKTFDQKIHPNENGYFSQPEKPVRRSLCFAENLNPDNCSSDLLPMKLLDFEGSQGFTVSEDFSSKKCAKPRNRLQVFQGITP